MYQLQHSPYLHFTDELTPRVASLYNQYRRHFAPNVQMSGQFPNSSTRLTLTRILQQLGYLCALHNLDHTLNFSYTKYNYSLDYLNNLDERPPLSTAPVEENTLHIDLYHIARGYSKYFTLPPHAELGEHINNLELALVQHSKHRIEVYQPRPNVLVIVTSHVPDVILPRLLSYYLLLSPKFADKPDIIKCFEALFTLNLEPLITALDAGLADIAKKAQARTVQQFLTEITNVPESARREVEQRANNKLASINDLFNQINTLHASRQEDLATLYAWEVNPPTLDPALQAFLETTQNIVCTRLENSSLYFDCITPLSIYRPDDFQAYYRNTDNIVHRRGAHFAEALRRIFIEGQYQVLSRTSFMYSLSHHNLSASTNPNPKYFGNPHIKYYNCFTSSKRQAIQAAQKNDYLTFFNVVLAAAATINFTDHPVVSRLCEQFNLLEHEPILQSISDPSSRISLAQLKEIIKGETS